MKNFSSKNLGKTFCNLISNKIIQIFDNTEQNLTEITVTDHGNFIIFNGWNTLKENVNISDLINPYIKSLNGERSINIIDLIVYNSSDKKQTKLKKVYSYVSDYSLINICEELKTIDSYDLTIDKKNNVVFTNHDLSSINSLKEYKFINNNQNFPIISDRFYGLSSFNYEKLYDFYIKYICYNVFEKQLSKDLTIYFEMTDLDKINYDTVIFNIKSERKMTSLTWMKSMILDLFKLDKKSIIEKFDFYELDFEDELLNPLSGQWSVRDMTKEMVLF